MPDIRLAAVAANRFGYGARPGELQTIAGDPRGWLAAQIAGPAAFSVDATGLTTRAEATEALAKFLATREVRQMLNPQGRTAPEMPKPPENSKGMDQGGEMAALSTETQGTVRSLVALSITEAAARTNRALSSTATFAERLVHFWANHFTISTTRVTVYPFAGLYEREVIRPGMTGGFSDLLLNVCRHPAMLLYLDQAQSRGPTSPAGQRANTGLNENLAREVLELMTLGAQGGYTQADVTEFAKALTGWTLVSKPVRERVPTLELGAFVFIPQFHEPGPRTVLGKTYAQAGEDQAAAILRDLSVHPATARTIATKLARHFISDEPPPGAVAALAAAFTRSNGSLPALHETLIGLPEAWDAQARKFKSPNDFIVSGLRLTGLNKVEDRALIAAYTQLGQVPYRAPSPKGWPDDAASWSGGDALMKRIEWAQALGQRLGSSIKPAERANDVLGPVLRPVTRQAIERAESADQGLTLALMSPEFQWR